MRYGSSSFVAASVTAIMMGTSGCGSDEPEGNPDLGAPTGDAGTESDSGVEEGLSFSVGSVFAPGQALREAYTGAELSVASDGTVRVSPGPEGVVLLERADAPDRPAFTWDNATVYFLVTDRFENGNTANDEGHGRDFSGMPAVGTFHGGDIEGIRQRLDYLDALGVDALWMTPPVEQVHGYVAGGGGNFPHYGYAGYWALDFTRLDENFGTEAELQALVDEAHARGIRVLFDVVMNHPGYATFGEVDAYLPEALDLEDWKSWRPAAGQDWEAMYEHIDYGHAGWSNWWGPDWIRAGFPGHEPGGSTDQTRSLAFLPDFRTEDASAASFPPFLNIKTDTQATPIEGATVTDYLVEWHSRWVRDFGIDGFRCDTAKHVDFPVWAQLEASATEALAEWKRNHPDKALDETPFWMTGEVFPHGPTKDAYFSQGRFDSLINFDFRSRAASLSTDLAGLDALYGEYASALNTDPEFNVLTFISSHDTALLFEVVQRDRARMMGAATAFMLLPGAVQIYYGDESGRTASDGMGDNTAGTRSDMNWTSTDSLLLEHWRKLGTFRRRHPAIGAGTHTSLQNDAQAFVFARETEADAVVVAIIPDSP